MRIINKVKFYILTTHRNNDFEKILQTVNIEKFRFFQNKYKDSSPYPGYSKYLNIEEWLEVKLVEVYKLGLNKSINLDILDIGTGAGYFPFVCNYYGHNSMALDLGNIPMYNEIIKLLNINRQDYEIKSFEKLPDLGKKFDLIAAFSICFNQHDTPDLWNVNEWHFFLKDLAINHLKEKGKVYLVLNPERNNKYYDNKLYNFFIKYGAKVDRSRVYFKDMGSFRS